MQYAQAGCFDILLAEALDRVSRDQADVATLDELERKKVELIEHIDAAPADVPEIHPNIAGIYRRKVERFNRIVDDPALRAEAAEDTPITV
ncbi:MAG: recombinase family protein [Sphingobium sp.]